MQPVSVRRPGTGLAAGLDFLRGLHDRKRPTRYLLTLLQMVYVVQLKMAHMYHRI
jgi:hypothetical protein